MNKRHATLVSLLLLAAALAGCSDGGDGTDSKTGGPTVTPPPGKGAIVGVVVDGGIRPLAGVAIEAIGPDGQTGQAVTADDGSFVFDDLAPGSYFVKATKPGYYAQQRSVEVVADDDTPDVVRILLEADPENRPFVETFRHDGFIECGGGAGGAGVNPCAGLGNSNNAWRHEITQDRVADWIQTEMTWEPSSDVGQSLSLSYAIPDSSATDGFDDYNVQSGRSPLIVTANHTLLQDKGVGAGEELLLRVFGADSADDPATVTVQQQFRAVTHVFYGYTPPEGWTFGENEEVPAAP